MKRITKRTFYKDGTIWIESQYVGNKLDGLQRFFNKNGELYTELLFENGEIVVSEEDLKEN